MSRNETTPESIDTAHAVFQAAKRYAITADAERRCQMYGNAENYAKRALVCLRLAIIRRDAVTDPC